MSDRVVISRRHVVGTGLALAGLYQNYFNQNYHLNRRDIFKRNRAAALAEWCQLAA